MQKAYSINTQAVCDSKRPVKNTRNSTAVNSFFYVIMAATIFRGSVLPSEKPMPDPRQ